MPKRSFKFNPNFCFIDTSIKKPSHSCLFDSWSIDHFYWHGFFYIILHHLLKLKNIKHVVILTLVLTIFHAIEELQSNKKKINIEKIFFDTVSPLLNEETRKYLPRSDNDYIDNSLGDILSGLTSNLLIVFFWMKTGNLPYYYLLIFVLLIYKGIIFHTK